MVFAGDYQKRESGNNNRALNKNDWKRYENCKFPLNV